MKSNRSPGSDGFTCEFFKTFWKQIGAFVVRSINYAYQEGHLSVTQKQGIITCLPKGDKPRHFLKNWRPISLLNTIYKIASGSIACRMKNVLHKIIHTDQTGFISGRYIGENSRLIYDIMEYTEQENIPGLLLLIDFEKAFDSVSWSFIQKVTKFFNFGDSIRKWISVFYTDISARVNQGGNISDSFTLHRGCRQGDPLSPYIFILCAEILAIQIRNNNEIQGIKVRDKEYKLTLYADDSTLLLNGSERSLKVSLEILESFSKISGLHINYSKTEVIWIGSKIGSAEILCHNYNLEWGKTKFRLLGLNFNVNLDCMPKENFDCKLITIKNVLKNWDKRNLTPIGKIVVLKTLALPILNHIFISLPTPAENQMKELENLAFSFIWGHKTDRIKRDIITRDYSQGGLRMVNIKLFIQSLKLSWIRRLIFEKKEWKHFIEMHISTPRLLSCGSQYASQISSGLGNKFWKEVFKIWADFKFIVENSPTIESVQMYLFLIIKILWLVEKHIFKKTWFDKKICLINDLLDFRGNFYTYNEFITIYDVKTNFLEYHGVIAAVKHWLQRADIPLNFFKLQAPTIPISVVKLIKNKKGSKEFYLTLMSPKSQIKSKGMGKWANTFDLGEDMCKKIFRLPFVITKNSKLQWFQTRINHRILGTNRSLFKMKITQSPLCSFCRETDETIEHLFWECDHVQSLLHRATDKARKSVITHWKSLKTHWKYKLGVKIRISILRYALGDQRSAYWLPIHVLIQK